MLTYLAVAARRQGHDAEVETFAGRGLTVAEAAGMLDYIGACRGNLAWLAWRRGELAEARRLGLAALEAWPRPLAPYPFHWQALWPLIGVALAQGQIADAVAHARSLLDPTQQALPAAIEQPLAAALTAWDAGQPAIARGLLTHAFDRAQSMNLT